MKFSNMRNYLFLTPLVLSIFFVYETQAAQLKSVQTGTSTIAAGSASQTATLSPALADTAKAFLVFSVSENTSDPQFGQISGQITNSTTLTFARATAAGSPAVTIKWYVAEFLNGVSVRRGSATMTNLSTVNAPLTSVDTAKSFPIVSFRTAGADFSNNDFVKAKITTNVNLELALQGVGDAGGATVEWQVVEFIDANVTTGDVSFGTSDTSVSATVSISNLYKAWLIYTYNTADGTAADIGQKLVRGRILSSTELIFDRVNTGQAINLTWYLVQFTDQTNVQSSVQAFTGSETQKDVTLTSSVDTTRSIAVGGYFCRGGRSNYSAADNPGVGWFTLDLTTATNLQITRGLTGNANANVAWFVVEFAKCSFSYRKSITVNAGQVSSGPQTNYPLLVKITSDNDLRSLSNGGHMTHPSGYDIIFKGLDATTCGGTAPCDLDHEIERYNPSTGELIAWVRVPSVNDGTVIYIYYGNNCLPKSQEVPTRVWDSNYVGVWHLKESGGGVLNEFKDSTANANHGTGGKGYSGYVPTQITIPANEKIGYGQTFDGVNDFIDMASSAWLNSNWPYRKRIVIQGSQVSGTSVIWWFPVLIKFLPDSYPELKHTSYPGGHVGKIDGTDILFTNDEGIKIYHEIEKYDPVTGELIAWVRVPQLYAYANTTVYMYYGYALATDQQNVSGTWDENGANNYKGVWHLKEDPSVTAPQMKDSTLNARHGTSGGSMTSGDQVVGKVNGSLDFDGVDDRISVGSIIGNSTAFTVSAWFRTTSTSTSPAKKIYGEGNSSTNTPFIYIDANETTVGDVEFCVRDDSNNAGCPAYSGGLNDGNWHYLVGVQSAKNNRQIFVDGILRGTNSTSLGTVTVNTGLIGGISRSSGPEQFFADGIDEVRISTTARSADWIQTEFNNQSSPSTFYQVLNEEQQSNITLDLRGNAITLQAWVKFNSSANNSGVMTKNGWADGYDLYLDTSSPSKKAVFVLEGDEGYSRTSAGTLTAGVWHHVVGTWDGATMRLYLDGAVDTNTLPKMDTLEAAGKEFWIGHGDHAIEETWSYPWWGDLDEVRVSKVARSAGWILTEYRNQNAPSSFYALGTEATPPSEECSGPYLYRKPITVNGGQVVDGPHTNFPMLVNVTDPDLRTATNGGYVRSASGYDIIFRGLDSITCGGTPPCGLSHEIERYVATTGELVAWVKVPSINNGSVIYIYYGNSCNTTSTANPGNVWDSYYKGVWHLKEATGTTVYDSTTTPDNGTPQNSPSQVSGNIDGSLSFNPASSQYVSVPNSTDLQLSTNMTVSGWVNTTSSDFQSRLIVAKWLGGGNKNYWLGKYWPGATTLQLSFAVNAGSANVTIPWNINDGAWHYVVGVADVANSLCRLYVDGGQQATVGYGGTSETGSSALQIGKSPDDALQLWSGGIDEVRVSSTARSAGWIQTEYNNQKPSSAFYTVGQAEAPGYAPTAVVLRSFKAIDYNGTVLLQWKTSYEVNNLGFHIYREEGGQLTRLTPEPVAGSALLAGSRTALTAGHHYNWWDFPGLSPQSSSIGGVKYWLKDIDLSGKETMHGPVTPVFSREPLPEKVKPDLLSELGMRLEEKYHHYWKARELKEKLALKRLEVRGAPRGRGLRTGNKVPLRIGPAGLEVRGFQRKLDRAANEVQRYLAGKFAVKLLVKEEGWYRVSQPELVAAGLSPRVNPRHLHLYVDGREQPIRVIGEKDARFGLRDAIEFYGVGLDTPSTDTRVYWLIEGIKPGKRIHQSKGYSDSSGSLSSSGFPYTVEKEERAVYFAALRNGDEENFFGPVVYMNEVDQILELQHLDRNTTKDALLEVVLQGATERSHRVKVLLNRVEIGEIVFEGQRKGTLKVEVPQLMLEEDDNLVSLVAMGDDMDATLLDTVRLTYWHTYTADGDGLRFTAQGGSHLAVDGFGNPKIRVVDITDSNDVIEVTGKVQSQKGGYAVSFRVPEDGERTLLALTDERAKDPIEVVSNHPSTWHRERNGYDLVIISHRDFIDSLQPLKKQRELQGLRAALIDVEDIYDEFSFGNKTPKAIKDFLVSAKANCRRAPRFVLLVGDASFDPRNYLGLGDMDYVPTKLIDTAYMETASDDWFVDFTNDGLPEMAIGRLPVRTVEEANAVVSKIINYERTGALKEALLVADRNDGFDFEGASDAVRNLLPSSLPVRKIFRADFSSDDMARGEILRGINGGPLLVNFIGHGSVEMWRGMFSTDDAESLVNGMRLPLFVSMTCLNGFFQDPYAEPLAEALLKAKRGGAIAVWTSSGLTEAGGQTAMNKELIRLLFGRESLTLGEAAAKAKFYAGDDDVRRTWILFGDPSTRLRVGY